jgi:hypothetical protein
MMSSWEVNFANKFFFVKKEIVQLNVSIKNTQGFTIFLLINGFNAKKKFNDEIGFTAVK